VLAAVVKIHPESPQKRLAKQVADVLHKGGVIAYPTDSSYALGCHLGDKSALKKIAQIRKIDQKHHFTLIGRDLGQIADYVKMDNQKYRFIKAYTPGPYTFILPAKRKVPRRTMHQKRLTIGFRIPDNAIVQEILNQLDEPILSSTLIMPEARLPLGDPDLVIEKLQKKVDMIVDGGFCGIEPTTVIDWVDGSPALARQGAGEISL